MFLFVYSMNELRFF